MIKVTNTDKKINLICIKEIKIMKMDLQTMINQPGATIIDVREPYEYELQHVSGAINIPVNSIMSRQNEIKNMKAPIIVYCRSGNRSQLAKLLLKASGLKEVYNGGSLHELLLLQDKQVVQNIVK